MKEETNSSSKRALLTGPGGSIGIHTLAHIFTNTDWHIVGIDSFRHKGWTDRIRAVLDDHPDWASRLTIITHDLIAPFSELTKKRIGKVDYIISMAAMSDVEESIQNPVLYVKNNVDVALTMLEFARTLPELEAFIQISTDEVYGAVASKDDDKCKEWSSIVPSNPYAASKACQEAIAISYWRTYGVPLIITNTMNNFGEMQQHSKFPVMVQKWIAADQPVTVHGSPDNVGSRSYIHSRNHSDAILFILQNLPPHRHEPNAVDLPDRYNIAGDRQLDNMELAILIADLMGKEAAFQYVDTHATRPGHDLHYGLDDSKLKNLGWKAPVSFEESLRSTIEWQTENEDWIK